jgi:multiple sugar transport system substrate-binding protein
MRLKIVIAGVLAVGVLAGCSSSKSGDSSASGTKKVDLTFWSWVPNMDQVVAKWNQSHPNVHVTYSKEAQGDDLVTKILTASKAGNAPDLFCSRPSTRLCRRTSATTRSPTSPRRRAR